MKRLIPADTVDTAGNVWETTGENIRHGVKEFSEKDIKLIVNAMFPVGAVYCGENSFILSVGKWTQVTVSETSLIVLGIANTTGTPSTIGIAGNTARSTIAIRMWKRVS